ncbi:streptamidine family RiPP [Saccharomonospora sp. NPDC046836]
MTTVEEKNIFVSVQAERTLPHNSASHSNALVENPFDDDQE